MELQTCLLVTTLVFCRADIRPAGWLDKVVAHWKKSFVDDFEQLGFVNLDATIEVAPPDYQDSPDWDFDSVARMLNLLSVSETGQPTLNALRRMIAPTRRMMMDVPGLAGSYIPQSLYRRGHGRGNYRSGMNDRRGNYRSGYRKRTGNNRMGTNNRMGMAKNRMGMANNRKDMAYDQMGFQSMTGNGKISRKQMLVKKKKERVLSAFQQTFRDFPSIKDKIFNNIYYDEEIDEYEDAPPEFEFVDPNAVKKPEDAIVVVSNPVEARLPSARISVKLLKQILEARAIAAREMPPKKTTRFSWKPMDITTPLNNGSSSSADNSTAEGNSNATTIAPDGGAVKDGDGAPTTPGGGGEAKTEAGDAPAEEPKPEEASPARRSRKDETKIADKSSHVVANVSEVLA